jgi:predicted HTH transcriptional regulator
MEVVKNRFVNEETVVYLEKVEGQFIVLGSTEIPIGVEGSLPTDLKIYDNQKAILNSMNLSTEYKFEEIEKNTGISHETVHHSIKRLLQLGLIKRSKYGHYMRIRV